MSLSLARLITALALVVALPVTAARPPEASAWGYAWGDFVIGCSTCGHYPITLSGMPDQFDSGPDFAAVSYAGDPLRGDIPLDYTLGGGAACGATAAFEGALASPLLTAFAWADNEPVVIVAVPEVVIGIDHYQVYANASTLREYTYVGAVPSSYTFSFRLTASLSGSLASVWASVRLYDGLDPYFETGLIDAGYAGGSGTQLLGPATTLDELFSVSVTLDPGQSFVMLASLSASTLVDYASVDVLADAGHTLRLDSVSGGDPQLLVTTPVPEPGTGASLALGLLFMAGMLRRRRAAN